jgi:hypothetical protein
MNIRDIVTINQEGLVAAVQLDMMADRDMNLKLCKGFVFNYNPDKPKQSTLGVLDAVRQSFHSSANDNVHLMVQDFGKGKSHFALTLANFFQQPADSPEVEGILEQIDFATPEKSQALVNTLEAFKQRSQPYLVVCVSGDRSANLGKLLLQGLQQTLASHGVTNTLAQHLIQDPLDFLCNLPPEHRRTADEWLAQQEPPSGLEDLIQDLQQGRYDLITTVKDLSKHLFGRPMDFQDNLDIETILKDIITQLCTGNTSRFSGMLILFDELNAYLRQWLENPRAAGGMVLQNITNACAQNKGKLALLCLAQVRPSLDTAVPMLDRKNYERFSTRLELAPSTYDPQSSLELVIKNLLKQAENSQGKAFRKQWDSTLLAESRHAYDKYITAYSNRNWPFETFHQHIGLGCYPLHPLTTYLLCNLSFTQGRNSIQFVKEEVARFVETMPVATNDRLNYVRPVQLFDAFLSDFSRRSVYGDYKRAYDTISASAKDEEITVLKAVALFYLSEQKLTKSDKEPHEEILSMLTGFSSSHTKALLTQLVETHHVLYLNAGTQTYRFFTGYDMATLKNLVEEEIEEKPPNFLALLNHCRSNLDKYTSNQKIVQAPRFVEMHRLNAADWQFRSEVCSVETLKQVLSKEYTPSEPADRGCVVYFLGEADQDLKALADSAKTALAASPQAVRERLILAIPQRGTHDLARILQMKQVLVEKNTAEKQKFGQALIELQKEFDKQIEAGLKEVFGSCKYICHLMETIPLADQRKLDAIASTMLDALYAYVPPVETNDKLRSSSNAGATIVSHAARQLLTNSLQAPFPNEGHKTLIDTVLVRSWGLLKPGKPYTVQQPRHEHVREAWDRISLMTDLGDRDQISIEISKIWHVLQAAPFGYNELTFTLLFVAWLVYHRGEVELSGSFGIPKKKENLPVRTAPLHDWASTNILEKVKDFVNLWIVQGRNRLVRRKPVNIEVPDRVDYDRAQALVQEIQGYQTSPKADAVKVTALKPKLEQLRTGIQTIQQWWQPVQAAIATLDQSTTLDDLAKLYKTLEAQPPTPAPAAPDVTIVIVSEQQQTRWDTARQTLRTKLEVAVEAIDNQAQTFTTQEDGYRCQAEIQRLIQVLDTISGLPSRFGDSLRTSQQQVASRLLQLQETEKVRDCLKKIRDLHHTLGNNASQNQYQRVQTQIQEAAEQVPSVQVEDEYKRLLTDIQEKQADLLQRIQQWEDRFSPEISKVEAVQLNQEINRELNRFDQDASRQQLETLSERINAKILEQEGTEADEKALKSVVQQAQQKAKATDELKGLRDAMQAYDELVRLALPTTSRIQVGVYQQQLEVAKADGRQAIESKLEQLFQACDRDLEHLTEYNQLKPAIQRTQTLIAEHSEFATLTERLKEAERALENKYGELNKRNDDRKIMGEVKRLKPSDANTIQRCEQMLATIADYQAKLHYPDQHLDEIQRRIKAFEQKRAEFIQQLEQVATNLSTVATPSVLKQYRERLATLEFVCKDSSEYPRYQILQTQLRDMEAAIERVTQLERTYQHPSSIVQCNEAIIHIDQAISDVAAFDRFRPQLDQLKAKVLTHKQAYISQIDRWQTELSQITTLRNARQLQNKLSGKASHYDGSDLETSYRCLAQDLDHLVNLYQLVENQKTDSLEACYAGLERLSQWQSEQTDLSSFLEEKIETCRQTLRDTQREIQTRQRDAANAWLTKLLSDQEKLQALSGGQALKAANALLSHIRQTRNQHDVFLEEPQKNALQQLVNTCEAIRNQDRTSKIISLFQELPRDQRRDTYQMLGNYLDAPTEVL